MGSGAVRIPGYMTGEFGYMAKSIICPKGVGPVAEQAEISIE